MKKELFDELIASIEEGGAILRNETKPSKKLNVKNIDVKKIREGMNLSQSQFAELLGISPGTIRNWEQGRRSPTGAARVLLSVAENDPEYLLTRYKKLMVNLIRFKLLVQ